MATASPSAAIPSPALAGASVSAWPPGLILRDITRGGLAGLVAGLLVGGVGGRLVMRLAALAVPDATGLLTENGNRIGDITTEGTLALVLFAGLFAGVVIATLWVTVSPWIPGSPSVRALLTAPIAVAIGSFVLIEGHNPDFFVLNHDPGVVAILVGLVALSGVVVALVDRWLDGRLPYVASLKSGLAVSYVTITVLGLLVGMAMIVPAYLVSEEAPVGIALVVTGIATLAWWYQRLQGRERPAQWVTLLGRGALLVAVVIGFVLLAGEIRLALLL